MPETATGPKRLMSNDFWKKLKVDPGSDLRVNVRRLVLKYEFQCLTAYTRYLILLVV